MSYFIPPSSSLLIADLAKQNKTLNEQGKVEDKDIAFEREIPELVLKSSKKKKKNNKGETINEPNLLGVQGQPYNVEYKEKDLSQEYTTGENKARRHKFGDPIQLNFRWFIDFSNVTGLFGAGEDSALQYLIRIGEVNRAEMLKRWIAIFRVFIKELDFLVLNVEGLEAVQTWKNEHTFLDKERLKITCRETTDMLLHGLIVNYKAIVYDLTRGVRVIPQNLCRFDSYIVVFPSGYYNEQLYGGNEKTLPTKGKLADENLNLKTLGEFNHTLYTFNGCMFDMDSGSSYVETISNEMSADILKNNFTMTYRFANVSGIWNNSFGGENYQSILAGVARMNLKTANKKVNTGEATVEKLDSESIGNKSLTEQVSNTAQPERKTWFGRQFANVKDGSKSFVGSAMSNFRQTYEKIKKNPFDKSAWTGALSNTLDDFTSHTAIGRIAQSYGLDKDIKNKTRMLEENINQNIDKAAGFVAKHSGVDIRDNQVWAGGFDGLYGNLKSGVKQQAIKAGMDELMKWQPKIAANLQSKAAEYNNLVYGENNAFKENPVAGVLFGESIMKNKREVDNAISEARLKSTREISERNGNNIINRSGF